MTGADLREWIALFLPELAPDGQGGARETIPEGLVYDRPAHVREISGAEVFAGDQIAQRVRYVITIRYDVCITTAHRVWWRDRYLDIDNVKNVEERSAWLELQCAKKEGGTQ